MIISKYPLKVGQEVAYFPPIQNTATPYATEAAMHADQANQLQGYGYLVDGVGAFTYLGTLAETAADYEAFGGGLDLRASNLAEDLSTAEKDGIRTKIDNITGSGFNYLEEDFNVNQNPSLHILNPKRGTRYLNNSNIAGAIKITLPTFKAIEVFSFTITLFGTTYTTNSDDHAVITIVGLSGASNFITENNQTVSIKTSDQGSDYNIRFGHDGVNDCIWIGELDQIFANIMIAITDLFVRGLDNGWSAPFDINRVQSFNTVQVTKTNNLAAADFNKLKNKPVGASGTFTTVDSKTVTVTNGIITSIV